MKIIYNHKYKIRHNPDKVTKIQNYLIQRNITYTYTEDK